MKGITSHSVKIVILYLFIFSLPFEYWDPLGIVSFLTITKFFGSLYAIFSVLNMRKNLPLHHNRNSIALLFFLWLWIVIQSILHSYKGDTIGELNFTFLQCVFFFWLVSVDFGRDELVAQRGLLSFVLGISSVALLIQFGVGYEVNPEVGENRLTFFGANPNSLGNWSAVGILMVAGLVFQKNSHFGPKRWLILICIPFLVFVMEASGSRGALLSLLMGLFIFFVFYKAVFRKKILIFFVGIIASYFLLKTVLESEVMKTRFEEALSDQNAGGRTNIWRDALEIFLDNPITGTGTSGYEYEMRHRYSYFLDTHNMFLFLLVAGGIVALAAYLIFLAKVLRSGYSARKIHSNALPLCLFFMYVLIVFKSGGIWVDKSMWLVLAYVYSFSKTSFLLDQKDVAMYLFNNNAHRHAVKV